MSLEDTIRDQWNRLKLVEIVVRESVGGQQAICKYQERISGPWGVGCDVDPVIAIEKALVAGEAMMADGGPKRNAEYREWTPDLARPIVQPNVDISTKPALEDLF